MWSQRVIGFFVPESVGAPDRVTPLDGIFTNRHTGRTRTPRTAAMTKARVLFCLTVILTLAGWASVRTGSRTASAQSPLVDDPFTEENATHRYVNNQPRHWRQMLNHR